MSPKCMDKLLSMVFQLLKIIIDIIKHFKHIVTYSGSLFTMELYCTPKVNTLQLNTVGNSSNTRTRLTYTVSEHSFL
jgi:hypothetical protein